MEIRSNYMDIERTNKNENGEYELKLPSLHYCPKCNCAFDTTHLKVVYDPQKFKSSNIWETIETTTDCPFCGNSYSKEYRDGGMAEIEEDVYEAIIAFNRKGYKSFASCEGHILVSIDDEDKVLEVGQPYIAFDLKNISGDIFAKNIERCIRINKIKGLSIDYTSSRFKSILDSLSLRPTETIDPEKFDKLECYKMVSEFRSGVLELAQKIQFHENFKPSRRGGSLSKMNKVSMDLSNCGNYYCFNCGNYHKNEIEGIARLTGEYVFSGKGGIDLGSCNRCPNCGGYHDIIFNIPGKVIDKIIELQEEFSEEYLKFKSFMISPNKKGVFVRFSLDIGEHSVKIVNSRKFTYLDNEEYRFYIPYSVDQEEFLERLSIIEEVLLDV